MKEQEPGRRGPIELAYASFAVFADDGKLDISELNFLLGLALRDGKISDDEEQLPRNVFKHVHEKDVSTADWKRIEAVRAQHGI